MLNEQQFEQWFKTNYIFNGNGKIIGKKGGYYDATKIYTKYFEIMSQLGVTSFTQQEISDKLDKMNPNKPTGKPQIPTCRNWICNYLSNHKNNWSCNDAMTEIQYDATGLGIFMASGLDDLYDRLVEFNGNSGKPYEAGMIRAVLNNIAKDSISTYLSKVYQQIKYDETCIENGNNFIKGLYDYLKVSESFDIFNVLMKHWAWQVKRKLLGKDVRNHIWINFYGATGLGKSRMIENMCKVMEEFLSTTTIAKLFDDTKEIKRLTEKYILNFDELAINGNEPGDGCIAPDQLALLKQILTGKYLDTRVYGTQQQSRRKITFTCISSANYHLYDTIFDEQSMRRFFEFHCEAAKPKNYDKVNALMKYAIDFWKSINEFNDMGYWVETDIDMWKTIENIQKNYYPTKTTVSQWISFNKIIKGEKTAKEIYPVYKLWCDENGFRNKKTLPGFIEEMKHRFPKLIDPTDGIVRLDIESKENVLKKESLEKLFTKKSNDNLLDLSKVVQL